MPGLSPRHFQDGFRKNSKTDNIFIKPKDMTRHEELDEKRQEVFKKWITFFRRNPHRFIESYLGIHLYPYQILMIWMLQRSNLAYIAASRAVGKTFMIAVWALTLALLYPGIKVIVCAKTLKQGGIIISEKLTSLRDTYPNVAREIRHIVANSNNYEATFHCGSTIKVVPSAESSRGNRANYIVVEEARLVPKEILDPIIKPFLFSRTPPYRLKTEYANDDRLKEEGIISYISSAWYKSDEWYKIVRSCIKRMVSGDETANFLALDYLICLRHNIKTEEMLKNEMNDSDEMTVQMEYLNIPVGNSSKSYYKFNLFKRNLKRAFYPQKTENYVLNKNPYQIKKTDGELRIISVDIATRANKTSDNTIIGCARLIPMLGKGYQRDLLYMESYKGLNTILQAKRIKEIFYDFEADYLVQDLQQAGISVFDSLSQVTLNEERGVSYPAFTVSDHEMIDDILRKELKTRTLGVNAVPVVFPILGTGSLNSAMASAFRVALQKKLWNFLIPDSEAEDFLFKTNKEFANNDNDDNSFGFFINPYVQTGLLINETINLDMSLLNGFIKLTEKQGSYKDRFSCIEYLNWVVNNFDKELLKETSVYDDWDTLAAITNIS